MKIKAMAVLAAIVLAGGFIGISIAQEERAYVHRLVFVGKGIGIPGDGNLDNLKWIDRAAVGSVRRLNQTHRTGIMKVTDSEGEHNYKLRNIEGENGSVSADIYDNETVVGRISVSYRPVSGKEAWAGDLTLGSWTGKVVIQGFRASISNEQRNRIIREERNTGDCQADNDCEFLYHMKNTRADARSREFIREKCAMEENRLRCRNLIEGLGPEDAGAAVESLEENVIANINLSIDRVQANIQQGITDIQARQRIMMRLRRG